LVLNFISRSRAVASTTAEGQTQKKELEGDINSQKINNQLEEKSDNLKIKLGNLKTKKTEMNQSLLAIAQEK